MTRSATEPRRSARAERHEQRKRRRDLGRRLERSRRSALTLLVLSGAGLLLLLSCSFGAAALWCLPEPFALVLSIGVSSIAGLALGGLIRIRRERRALERDDGRA